MPTLDLGYDYQDQQSKAKPRPKYCSTGKTNIYSISGDWLGIGQKSKIVNLSHLFFISSLF